MSTTTEAVPLPKTRSRRSGLRFALFAFLLTVIAGIGLTAGGAVAYAGAFDGKIMPGVSVAGVLIGGLDPEAARERLLSALPDPSEGSLTLRSGDEQVVLSYADLHRTYNVEPSLDAAMAVGRSGSPLDRSAEQLSAATRGISFDVSVVTYDRAVVDEAVDTLVSGVEQSGRDATVSLGAGAGGGVTAWQVEPSQVGIDVDADALRTAAHTALSALGTVTADTVASAAQQVLEPIITTAEAEAAAARANAVSVGAVTLRHGETTYTITADTIRSWISVDPTEDGSDYAVTMDTSRVEPLLTGMLGGLDIRPVDASFKFAGNGVIEAVAAHDGLRVDMATTSARVSAALDARATGSGGTETLDVATAVVEPSFTTAQAQDAAPRVRRQSQWTTYFTPSVANYAGRNISVPTHTINEMVVAPGRWFDFLRAIGPITRGNGYGPGGAIINGRTKLTGAMGGGMCSCSTTLFNAALRAGLEMGQRRNHYYYISRYPVGLDATVWYSSGGGRLTMRFRNDTDYPVLIRGKYRYGVVRFEIWTVPTGRRVSLSAPVIRDRQSARETVEYTSSLAPGTSRRVEYPADGFKAWVTRTVRDRDGNLLHEDTFFSNYSRVDGITLVGVTPDDPRSGTIAFR